VLQVSRTSNKVQQLKPDGKKVSALWVSTGSYSCCTQHTLESTWVLNCKMSMQSWKRRSIKIMQPKRFTQEPGYLSWTIGSSIPGRPHDSPLRHNAQTDSGAHQASYPMSTGITSSGAKRPQTTHLHQVVSKLRMRGAKPPPPYICMAWWLVKYQENFTLIY
jgi:hypothetical protein